MPFKEPSPKYKGKMDKIDVIEDILGTEALKGTYKEREKVAKMLRAEKAWVDKYNRLKAAKLKKLEEDLAKQEQDSTKVIDIYRKAEFVFYYTLEPEALTYLNIIKEKEPLVYREMFKYLMQPNDIKKLDKYVETLQKRGFGPKNKVKLDTIIRIERKVKNIKPKIEVVDKDGKRIPFGRKIA